MHRYALVLLLFALPLASHASALQEGLWQIQVTQNIGGMPVDKGALRFEQCLTARDPIPTAYLQPRSCRVLEREEKYRKLHWRISCFTEHGTVVNEGFVRLQGRRMRGRSQSALGEVAGRQRVLRYQLSGVRIGECAEGANPR